ncbi:hypothetical protein EC991_003537 [Linnemannia zychae]|nr:hypothetical protein EC991_003537 [Linnemannia zychae]
MVDAGQSWGNIEALAGEEAFDRYYLFLDPSLEEFWTTNKVVELNDVVIDHVGRFLEPRVPSILKGINRPWYSKDATENEKNSKDKGEVNKVAKIYPVVVMAAWMDMFRWEKVARSVNSSPLVCQHIWETFGNGRPYSAEEEPFLDEIKVVAIENASRISAEIKEAVAKVEAARIQAEEEEEDRVEAIRVQEAKDEAERIEAIRIQAEKDEAERVEAAKEEMKRVAAEMKRVAAETKRIEANKARTIKRRAKVEAARAEAARAHAARLEAAKVEAERMEAKRVEAARVEIEKSEVMKVTAKKDPSRIQSAEICATKQQYIVMQEIISKDEPVEQEAAKRNVAIEKATRRQSRKETQEDAMAKDRSSREAAALAAAKAWDLAVRAVKDRGARIVFAV